MIPSRCQRFPLGKKVRCGRGRVGGTERAGKGPSILGPSLPSKAVIKVS